MEEGTCAASFIKVGGALSRVGERLMSQSSHRFVSRRRTLVGGAIAILIAGLGSKGTVARAQGAGFDHSHAAWTDLLKKNMVLINGGEASAANYQGFANERTALGQYLTQLSSVTRPEFDQFSSAQQQAFLINAYNAFTVELILTRYPDLKSIKDLGSLFSGPWTKEWINLLGQTRSLDNIEHVMLREKGRYNEPRVHFAVNCASIGCPMLREEAFTATALDAQLEEQARRFMADSSRNRYDAKSKTLYLSKIFDWYTVDFEQGYRGIDSLQTFARQHADQLTLDPAARASLLNEPVSIRFLSYDWNLNDSKAMP
jgi:hypothetical protein